MSMYKMNAAKHRIWCRRCALLDEKVLVNCRSTLGDHATKFATANTAANCQVVGRWQFSARSSQDAGGVSRMHKYSFATQPRDWPTTSEEAWRFDANLHATERPSTAPNGHNEPARCPRLTLEHRRRRREWGRRQRVWDLRQWRHYIFSDESQFSLYHSDGRVRVRRRQGERLIDVCVQPNDGNRGPSVMVWGAIHHGGRNELVMVDGAINRNRYIQILRNQMLPWRRGCLDVTLCMSKTMPRPIQHVTRQPLWTDRMLRSWTGQLGIQTWTQLSMFGIKCQSGSETWMTPFHRSWTKQWCPPGVGCSSARKGADPGREHASSCQGSSGR